MSGSFCGCLGAGTWNAVLLAPERHVVEKPERVRGLGARTPRPLPRLEQVGQVALHLVGGQLVGRPSVVAGQTHHLPDVRLVRAGGEPSHRHMRIPLHPDRRFRRIVITHSDRS
jgi:hypothetical protein